MTGPDDSTTLLYSPLAADPDLTDIVELFAQEMPGRLARLAERLNASDWEAVRRAAHQLKGSAGSYGFAAITPAAARLESDIVQSQPEEKVRRTLDELIELCGRVRAGTAPRGADPG